ncbi:MAG: right-handed parallel beta-helix repeat-containing protein [Betaproteobacteria bacterium]|nr:right-handed parallel beta-helix repeat-containing protein [Betaproteobacteria bacterium]
MPRSDGSLLAIACPTIAAEIRAGPDDYRNAVRRLRAGDTLRLAPGVYTHGLNVHRLEGAEGRPIVIRGADAPRRTVFVASPGRNTVSIVDSAHVTVSDLSLTGGQVPVDAVKAEGHARYAHHITLERLRIEGYDASQQNVAISTKCPAWNWTIRDNRIEGAGTGIYLGNSDGSAPFVRGVIEGNVIVGTRGYSMQIKHQREWPDIVDAADERGETIIRYNTFAKDARSSAAELARPNLLLGHWPLAGRGSADRYLVYGNLFLDNPSEALLQAEGNVVLYNNVFVNRHGDGVMLREHNDVPRAIDVFGNTVLARGMGVLLRNADSTAAQEIDGNAIFAGFVEPVNLSEANFFRSYEGASAALRMPFAGNRALDLAPKGREFDVGSTRSGRRALLPDAGLDFDRKPRGATVIGAYASGAPADRRRFGILDAKPTPVRAPAR